MVGCLESIKQTFFANCPYKIKINNGLEFYKYIIKNNSLFIENQLVAEFNNENDAILAMICDFFSFRCKNRIKFQQPNEPNTNKIQFYIKNVFLYYFPDQTKFVKENKNQIQIGDIIITNEENVQNMIYEICCYKFQQRIQAYLEIFC